MTSVQKINKTPLRSGPFNRARSLTVALIISSLTACVHVPHPPSNVNNAAVLTPATPSTQDLLQLPPPRARLAVAVYGFRDQTGQYKPYPESSFSTSVTQGATSLLVKALKDSRWYVPVERESLQELLTERRIVRALDGSSDNQTSSIEIPPLVPAEIMMDGGIISYESNVRTGGAGARYLGIGASTQYRIDQVTINLRSIDIRTGQILQSVSTTKTIYSYEIHPSVYKFVNFKDLLEIEAGVTSNEPAQISVKEAIDSALVHLIVQGLEDGNWELQSRADYDHPVLSRYRNLARNLMSYENYAATQNAIFADVGFVSDGAEALVVEP